MLNKRQHKTDSWKNSKIFFKNNMNPAIVRVFCLASLSGLWPGHLKAPSLLKLRRQRSKFTVSEVRVPWTARRSNQSSLKEISPGISLEGMMLRLKLQYFGHLMWRVDSLEKTLMLEGIGGQEEKGTTEDKMAGWHHWLDGPESEWTPGVGDGQGGLACCDSGGRKESDTAERLNWTELKKGRGF